MQAHKSVHSVLHIMFPSNLLRQRECSVQAALGVTGVEGMFRKGCESILSVNRKHATSLTRHMQAILTDPLVCWSGEKRPGSKKVSSNFLVLDAMIWAKSALIPRVWQAFHL